MIKHLLCIQNVIVPANSILQFLAGRRCHRLLLMFVLLDMLLLVVLLLVVLLLDMLVLLDMLDMLVLLDMLLLDMLVLLGMLVMFEMLFLDMPTREIFLGRSEETADQFFIPSSNFIGASGPVSAAPCRKGPVGSNVRIADGAAPVLRGARENMIWLVVNEGVRVKAVSDANELLGNMNLQECRVTLGCVWSRNVAVVHNGRCKCGVWAGLSEKLYTYWDIVKMDTFTEHTHDQWLRETHTESPWGSMPSAFRRLYMWSWSVKCTWTSVNPTPGRRCSKAFHSSMDLTSSTVCSKIFDILHRQNKKKQKCKRSVDELVRGDFVTRRSLFRVQISGGLWKSPGTTTNTHSSQSLTKMYLGARLGTSIPWRAHRSTLRASSLRSSWRQEALWQQYYTNTRGVDF